jgi:hypothetical protein
MSRHISRKAWPLVVIGLVAFAMLARHNGGRRRRAHYESEDHDGV